MKRVVLAVTALSAALSGCANMIGVIGDVDASTKSLGTSVDASIGKIPSSAPAGSRLLYTTVVPGSWLGAKKMAPRTAPLLPAAFNDDVTLKFPGRANMSTVAERITEVTGIPVKLSPDIYISTSSLAPKGSGSTPPAAGPAQGPVVSAPPPLLMPSLTSPSLDGLTSATANAEYDSSLNMRFSGKLDHILDTICAKTGTNWEYKNGVIVFSRLVTKTFDIDSTPGNSELKASIGKNGTGGNAGGSNFAADSIIKMNSSFSVWDSLRTSLDSMKSGVGKYAVNEATGTVTVTDTREVVEQVGKMLTDINHSLKKMVAFRVEVLSVRSEESADYGIDWSAIFNKVAQANPNWKFTFGSPSSLASPDASSIGYQILTKNGSSSSSSTSSAQAMIAALGGTSKASIVTTASALTTNRQPVPVAITDQTSYVQSVSVQQNPTQVISTGGSSSVPPASAASVVQVTPGVVTTGFILNLLPAVSADNSVTLHFSLDISSLKKLGTFGSGSSAVQSPEVSAMQFMQHVSMKNGETLILSGYERTSGQYDRRGVTKDADLLFGGSMNGKKARESIVIMVTPVVSEGS